MDRHDTPTEILYYSVVLCVFEISLFYSVTTIGSMDIQYTSIFLKLGSFSHHQVSEFYTFTCIRLLVYLHWPVFTYLNVGLLVMPLHVKRCIHLYDLSQSLPFFPSSFLLLYRRYISFLLWPPVCFTLVCLRWLILVVEGEVRVWLTSSNLGKMRFLPQGV
jgi:hypothetical protein